MSRQLLWNSHWRQVTLTELDQDWDLIIIGGGITGAGIHLAAARAGLRALLLEQSDFGSGTSSMSTKLVHGGLRYLRQAKIGLVKEAAREREQLIAELPGLVERLDFIFPVFRGDSLPLWQLGVGLAAYDLLVGQWTHQRFGPDELRELVPVLRPAGLRGGYRYVDAVTDDARLVMRVLRSAAASGGIVLNYTRVKALRVDENGQVAGVVALDEAAAQPNEFELRARVVINAAGPGADQIRAMIGRPGRLRKLRGSHMVLPSSRLPLDRALTTLHPDDQRPLFAVPWQRSVVFGTTDIDHERSGRGAVRMAAEEREYLLAGLQAAFPGLDLNERDLVSSFSGLRPVVDSGAGDPSRASREHEVWLEDGLLTVAGGKLTTFRPMARSALAAISAMLNLDPETGRRGLKLETPPLEPGLVATVGPQSTRRLTGRYGPDLPLLLATAAQGDYEAIEGTGTFLAELRWAARAEAVVHLDDLLLRRTRVGLLLPDGGSGLLASLRGLVQSELSWDDGRWETEAARYTALWRDLHNPLGP